MKTDYSWQAWTFVVVFTVGALCKTVADWRVARATERLVLANEMEAASVDWIAHDLFVYKHRVGRTSQ